MVDSKDEILYISLTQFDAHSAWLDSKSSVMYGIDLNGDTYFNARQMLQVIREIDDLVDSESGEIREGLIALRTVCEDGLHRPGTAVMVVGD